MRKKTKVTEIAATTKAKWRMFDQVVQEVREAFAEVPADKLRRLVDQGIQS
jgi:hypothetical protein